MSIQSTNQPRGQNFFVGNKHCIDVIAHRGGGGLWPGETLFAFVKAVQIGVTVLEMDVRATCDDQLVLMHNWTVNATTNGNGPLRWLKLSEIQKLDAGYMWTDDGGLTYPYRGLGISVPTLEQTLTKFKGTRMNIEIKGWHPLKAKKLAAKFCRLLEDFGMDDKVLVASFHPNVLRAVRQESSKVATSANTIDIFRFLASIRRGTHPYKPEAEAIQISSKLAGIELIDEDLVKTAHLLGFKIHAWTVNDRAEMRRLIRLDVDGIITDYPDRLLSELNSMRNSILPQRSACC